MRLSTSGRAATGPILYGTMFCVVVPLLLIEWAVQLEPRLRGVPQIESPVGGAVAAVGGLLLLGRGMWDLWHTGGGLPMNAYPPPRLVSSGAYRWFAHPIYVGFGILVPGVAIALGSRAGVWVITPVTWLAMIALVFGYERIDLRRRFGRAADLPARHTDDNPPPVSARITAALRAFVPWLVAYEACVVLGPATGAADTMTNLEQRWPVWEWTAVLYLGAYGWIGLAPMLARSPRALKDFERTAWIGTAFITWCFLAFPLVSLPRMVDAGRVFGRALLADRSLDTVACAFPSFHVFWAFAAADLWSERWRPGLARGIAVAIAVSCSTTGVHSLVDIAAGWAVYAAAARRERVWALICAVTERVANSWRDWRIGPVRVINHGCYVAAATVSGLWMVGALLGPEYSLQVVTIALCGIVGAGVWGQWLEASSQLSRPFGYFGGMFGCCAGCVVVQLVWADGMLLAAAYATAAPVIQALGRLRCLVQGCCHGRPASAPWLGIRYTQPLSRVCRLAKLDGVPVYPTPLYSILGNILILGVLARLWMSETELSLIAGAYLILSTCARFMEEGYRGEPQTVRPAGLPIYQWLAVGTLLAGIALTTQPTPVAPLVAANLVQPLAYALPLGLLVWLAMGVDFPESNRRMSRLA